jgi:hypothetical protein
MLLAGVLIRPGTRRGGLFIPDRQVCLRNRPAQQGAKGGDVVTIDGSRRVACLEQQQDICADAVYRQAPDATPTGQGAGRVGDSVQRIAHDDQLRVKLNDVNVDPAPDWIRKDEVPPGRFA